jgi:hypothetical protein
MQEWGGGISCCHHGAWLFFVEENSGGVMVAANLLPHSLFLYVILYMNIIEFIEAILVVIMPLSPQNDRT